LFKPKIQGNYTVAGKAIGFALEYTASRCCAAVFSFANFKTASAYSVIVFCDHEFFRPVRDDMLVENDITNCPHPVRDAMLVRSMMESCLDFTNISSLTGRAFFDRYRFSTNILSLRDRKMNVHHTTDTLDSDSCEQC
jgi:hypothetical protein